MKRIDSVVTLLLVSALNAIGRASAPLPAPDQSSAPLATYNFSQANQCAAGKVIASGKYMDDVLTCHALAASQGQAVGRTCLLAAARKLATTFASLEAAGTCKTTRDSALATSRIDASVAELVAMIGTRRGQCTANKLAATGKDGERQHSCYAEAVAKGAGYSVDSECQDRATQQLLTAFANAESLRDCSTTTADGPAVDARVRFSVNGARVALSPPIASCTPIEATAWHGASFVGNSRLAKIENSQVACMHREDGTVAACLFSTAPGQESGEWLESPQGSFALAGQAISLDGVPGGEWTVAAKVSDSDPAACVEPAGRDVAGLILEGSDLSATCTVEQMLAPWNTRMAYGWFPLVNVADREVCSADAQHPDGVPLLRSYSRSGTGPHDTFCYTGMGAALNDINGTERGWDGFYLPGQEFCHVIQAAGYEVPGAKRPGTRSFPAPGSINTQSSIVWRPVSPTFNIANGGEAASLQCFTDRDAFLDAADATPATGPLPDLGNVDEATVGTVTFSVATGGLAIGAAGTGAAPDWYPQMTGNEIALGFENLHVQIAEAVYALGFDFVEPNATMPSYGGSPVDSTFEMVLYAGATEVGRTTFNAVDDQVTFCGVWSTRAFDRVTIVDTTGNDDDEYFGEFYTGVTPR